MVGCKVDMHAHLSPLHCLGPPCCSQVMLVAGWGLHLLQAHVASTCCKHWLQAHVTLKAWRARACAVLKGGMLWLKWMHCYG